MLAEHRPHDVEVDGTHLGSQNGVALLIHLLGKLPALIGNGCGNRLDVLLPAHIHGGKQRANPNTDGTQIVHLVDFQQGIELVAFFQNFGNLVGSHRVQAAAEGIELDELQIVPLCHKLSRAV